jgi:chemotaxis protein MotA
MAKRKIDRSTVIGLLTAVCGVTAGLLLDGGKISQILQPTAALIVIGGTLGAVMVQFPWHTLRTTLKELRHVLFEETPLQPERVEELVSWCMQARRHGLLALDPHLDDIEDLFLKKGLTLAVDGVAVRELRAIMEGDLDVYEEKEESLSRVLEAAGGFSPTLGIIGAVIGLIQVMQHMEDVAGLGKGIAAAFVSTLYGIGLANLLFLPLAGKLRIRMRERQAVREMMLEAVISIVEGTSGRELKRRLQAYLVQQAKPQLQPETEMATL